MVMATRIKKGPTPDTGKMGIWDKPVSGDPDAPYDDPTAHWDAVKFHSDLQYLNDAISEQGISLTHQTVAGVTGTGYVAPGGPTGNQIIGNGQILAQDQTLYTHNLGYVPLFVVMWDGTPLYPGTVIYKDKPNGHYRFASAYATTSVIGIRNMGASGTSALPSQSFDYDVTIFRRPEKIDGAPLFHRPKASEPGERIVIGYGRITDEHVPLRRVALGDTDTFKYPISRCVDARAGTLRSVTLDGVSDFGSGFYNGSLISAQFINLAK